MGYEGITISTLSISGLFSGLGVVIINHGLIVECSSYSLVRSFTSITSLVPRPPCPAFVACSTKSREDL